MKKTKNKKEKKLLFDPDFIENVLNEKHLNTSKDSIYMN